METKGKFRCKMITRAIINGEPIEKMVEDFVDDLTKDVSLIGELKVIPVDVSTVMVQWREPYLSEDHQNTRMHTGSLLDFLTKNKVSTIESRLKHELRNVPQIELESGKMEALKFQLDMGYDIAIRTIGRYLETNVK